MSMSMYKCMSMHMPMSMSPLAAQGMVLSPMAAPEVPRSKPEHALANLLGYMRCGGVRPPTPPPPHDDDAATEPDDAATEPEATESQEVVAAAAAGGGEYGSYGTQEETPCSEDSGIPFGAVVRPTFNDDQLVDAGAGESEGEKAEAGAPPAELSP